MVCSFLDCWNSFGLEIANKSKFDAPGKAKGSKKLKGLPKERKSGPRRNFGQEVVNKIEIRSPRGGQVNPKGPTVEPKAGLETPQGCKKGAHKRPGALTSLLSMGDAKTRPEVVPRSILNLFLNLFLNLLLNLF